MLAAILSTRGAPHVRLVELLGGTLDRQPARDGQAVRRFCETARLRRSQNADFRAPLPAPKPAEAIFVHQV